MQGLVVSGIVKEGTFNKEDIAYVGPFGGKFKKIAIKSIHDNFQQFNDKLTSDMEDVLTLNYLTKKRHYHLMILKKDIL